MNAIKCPVCNGKKKICELGNIFKDCKKCSAIGWIDGEMVPDESKQETHGLQGIGRKTRIRRGRPSKDIEPKAENIL